MAKELGVSVNHFSLVVRGHRKPSVALAIKIEEVTRGEVTKEELIFPKQEERDENPVS